jgi:glyoxylase-like metal-dependent hydrolase (beta-lactamase superfamily II)
MKIKIILILSLTPFILMYGQDTVEYQVYALKIRESGFNTSAQDIAVGATEGDSVRACNMFWLLKGNNDKNILIDVGFVDTANSYNLKYITPTEALMKLNIKPGDISDIIVTHPHTDHIGKIDIFSNATVWMQKSDFTYFIRDAWQAGGNTVGFEKKDVRNLVDINLDGRLKLIDGDNIEIISGIRVFTGSKHTYENQYVLINSNSLDKKILVASDAIWFYYNLEHLLPIPLTFDSDAYIEAMKRMKTIVPNTDYIIPGHDDLVFTKFPEITEWIVKIEKYLK